MPRAALLTRSALTLPLSVALLTGLLLPGEGVAGLPHVGPQSVGIDPERLIGIETLIEAGIAQRQLPGCVVCIGRHGKIAWLRAYGARQLVPAVEPMTTETVFDLASLTKPIATATSVMLLVERGQLRLEDQPAALIPEFAANGKGAITYRQLLTHQSGLLPDNPLRDYQAGREVALTRICELRLQNPVGSKFVYSDVNFILLGEVVARLSGESLHEFTQRELFGPLGMTETGFLPREELRQRAAPTEQRDGKWIRGEVHDPRAYALGGVAGHAGLFSTAGDLAVYAQMLLNEGEYAGRRILARETIATMTADEPVSSGIRGLGWDKQTAYSTNKGTGFSPRAYGHGGFTGTVLWIDPELDLFFIFLSNRLHPDGKGAVNALAGKIATTIAEAIEHPAE